MKPASTAASRIASAVLPALSKLTYSTGTPRRLASSAARSGATPLGAPCGDPGFTSRKLLWLMPTRSLPLGASSARAAGVAGWLMAQVTDRKKRVVHASALRIIYVSIPFETALCWSAGDYPNMAAEKGGWDATILEVGGAGRRFHARRHERCARAIRLSLAAGAGHRRLSGGRQR